jgi:hypothetical protein
MERRFYVLGIQLSKSISSLKNDARPLLFKETNHVFVRFVDRQDRTAAVHFRIYVFCRPSNLRFRSICAGCPVNSGAAIANNASFSGTAASGTSAGLFQTAFGLSSLSSALQIAGSGAAKSGELAAYGRADAQRQDLSLD